MGFKTALAAALAVALVGVATPGAGSAADGEALFDLCATCHGDQGQGDPRIQAPAIGGLPEWMVEEQLVKFQTGLRGAHPDDVEGLRMRPMSRTLLGDDDVKNVAAYVASLPKPETHATLEGDATKGQALYATCMACHGMKAEGNAAMHGPPLSPLNDWYLLASLKKFRSGVRGGNFNDQWGVMMRPMAQQLVDEQAMKDVIAHIKSLSH